MKMLKFGVKSNGPIGVLFKYKVKIKINILIDFYLSRVLDLFSSSFTVLRLTLPFFAPMTNVPDYR